MNDFIRKLSGKKKPVDEEIYAGFIKRTLATFIDTTVLLIISLVFLLPMVSSSDIQQSNEKVSQLVERLSTIDTSQPPMLKIANGLDILFSFLLEKGVIANFLQASLLNLIIMGIVIIVFWRWKQGTPGKMLFGMKVVDFETNKAPSMSQNILRYLGYIVSALPLGLGFMWVGMNSKKRGFHDYISGTAVIIPEASDPEYKKRQFKKQLIIAGILFIAFIIYNRFI